MEHRRIYNKPLKNNNDFILSQKEGTTEWVSYHLIPNRAQLELELGIPVNEEIENYFLGNINVVFDYSVDEKSETTSVNDWLTIEIGKYTNKILGIKINCKEELGKEDLKLRIKNIFKDTSLIILKSEIARKLENDEVLKKSYKGIAKILIQISEDVIMRGFPEVAETI